MKLDISNAIFHLKKIENKEGYFPDYVDVYLKSYISFLKKNNVPQNIVDSIIEFSRNIYICLVEYYLGQHASAKYYFDQAINCINFQDLYNPIKENVFFRARKSNVLHMTKDEMFHIPLEKRYLVSTQRYSYPGLPCLYLGSSYQVCCEELDDWNDNLNIACVEQICKNEIVVLDLYFFEEYDFNEISDKEFEKFITLWPLVACCSFTYVNTDNMKFRPDYIISQLLLEYIIDKNADADLKKSGTKVCGIKYHSVKNDFFINNGKKQTITYNNFVFPVISNQQNGYCDVLKGQFDVKWVRILGELRKQNSNASTIYMDEHASMTCI